MQHKIVLIQINITQIQKFLLKIYDYLVPFNFPYTSRKTHSTFRSRSNHSQITLILVIYKKTKKCNVENFISMDDKNCKESCNSVRPMDKSMTISVIITTGYVRQIMAPIRKIIKDPNFYQMNLYFCFNQNYI